MSCGNLDPSSEKLGHFLKKKENVGSWIPSPNQLPPVITKTSLHMFRPPGFIASKKKSVKICKKILTDEKVQNIRLFNLSPPSVFSPLFFVPVPPADMEGWFSSRPHTYIGKM